MAKIESKFFDMGYLDTLSNLETPVHRLDPRAKLLTTFIFVLTVVSFDKYEISALAPFFLFPVVLITMGKLPLGFLLKKILLVSPFAFFMGIFNPLLDQKILMVIGSMAISGGWVSFISIMLRFVLTVSAALILVASTGFNSVCMALEKMGTPRIFAVQLLFLYRYLFVLVDEALRMGRARSLRSWGGKGMGFRVFASLVGHLLLRTIGRAQRIHMAMLSRGFDGTFKRTIPLRIRGPEIGFIFGWTAFFVIMRLFNTPLLFGGFFMEFFV